MSHLEGGEGVHEIMTREWKGVRKNVIPHILVKVKALRRNRLNFIK